MGNVFDNDLEVEPGARVRWQDRTASPPTDLLVVGYTATDPDGVVPGSEGSLLSGPAGTFRCNGGTSWSSLAAEVAGEPGLRTMAEATTNVGTVLDAFNAAFGAPLGSILIPAGELDVVGRTLRVRASIEVLATAAVTWELWITLNGTAPVPFVLPFSLPSGVGAVATFDVTFQVTTAGVAGIAGLGGVGNDLASSSVVALTPGGTSVGDLTADSVIQVRAQSNVASGPGLDTIRLASFIVDIG